MNKKLRLAVMALLALVFIASIVMLVLRRQDYAAGEADYAEAEALVTLPDIPAPAPAPEGEGETESGSTYVDPYADALRSMDFTALREVNDDVLGWLVIPGTSISYPLVQGTDNTYYLSHTWKKWTSAVGAIFLEAQNSADLSDFNTIVYGHRMNNGSMFAGLKYFRQQSYWAAHPTVYISDDQGSHQYQIFAAYEVSTAGTTYQIGFPGEADRQAFLDYCMDLSVIDTGVVPTVHDRVLTLSTCTGRGHATRWVVQAVLRGEAPVAETEPEATEPAEPLPEPEPETEGLPETAPAGEEQAETAEGQTAETPPEAELPLPELPEDADPETGANAGLQDTETVVD